MPYDDGIIYVNKTVTPTAAKTKTETQTETATTPEVTTATASSKDSRRSVSGGGSLQPPFSGKQSQKNKEQ